MSASEPASAFQTFDDVASRFPVTAAEAQTIAEALDPIQTMAGAGSDLGSVLSEAPGEGPAWWSTPCVTVSTMRALGRLATGYRD